jgi:predicted RNA-binding Zn-ribbon protein involved in translation (DUF1610 family)
MGITTGTQTQDVVRFCPECGSPSIESGAVLLEGSSTPYRCNACSWHGKEQDLLHMPFVHDFTGKEEMIKALMGDLRTVIAKWCATPIGSFLLKWGFLHSERNNGQIKLNEKQVSRYMVAISKAVLVSIIEERQKMEEEKIHGS